MSGTPSAERPSSPPPAPTSLSVREVNDAHSVRRTARTRNDPYSTTTSTTTVRGSVIPFRHIEGHDFTVPLLPPTCESMRVAPETDLLEIFIGQLPFGSTEAEVKAFCRGVLRVAPLRVRFDSKKKRMRRGEPPRLVPTGACYVAVATEAERSYAELFDKRAMFHSATIEVWKTKAAMNEWIAKRDSSAEAQAAAGKTLLKPITVQKAKTKPYQPPASSSLAEPSGGLPTRSSLAERSCSSVDSAGPAPLQPGRPRLTTAVDETLPPAGDRPASPVPRFSANTTTTAAAEPTTRSSSATPSSG